MRPVRLQDRHKQCIITKALNKDRRKGPQGKPDSSSMKGSQSQPDSLGMKGLQGQLESIVMKGPQDQPTSSTPAPPTATNSPVPNDHSSGDVRSICEGHSSQNASSMFGARREPLKAAPAAFLGCRGRREGGKMTFLVSPALKLLPLSPKILSPFRLKRELTTFVRVIPHIISKWSRMCWRQKSSNKMLTKTMRRMLKKTMTP